MIKPNNLELAVIIAHKKIRKLQKEFSKQSKHEFRIFIPETLTSQTLYFYNIRIDSIYDIFQKEEFQQMLGKKLKSKNIHVDFYSAVESENNDNFMVTYSGLIVRCAWTQNKKTVRGVLKNIVHIVKINN